MLIVNWNLNSIKTKEFFVYLRIPICSSGFIKHCLFECMSLLSLLSDVADTPFKTY